MRVQAAKASRPLAQSYFYQTEYGYQRPDSFQNSEWPEVDKHGSITAQCTSKNIYHKEQLSILGDHFGGI